jgi:hypothetical protein
MTQNPGADPFSHEDTPTMSSSKPVDPTIGQ